MSAPTTTATRPYRCGHAAIGAIISDMEPYLPPDTIDRPGYKHCRTTYGLLTTTYKRVENSDAPEKVYKELQQLETELGRRLHNLNASKGIPAKMTQLLNELKVALEHALSEGADANFLIQGMVDLLEEKPGTRPAPKPERVMMMPDTKYKIIRAELAEANRKIQKLNEENNSLVMYIRKLEAERVQHETFHTFEQHLVADLTSEVLGGSELLQTVDFAMTLNKRTGLYGVPSHHLYGAKPTPRPTYNSMDFAAAEVKPRDASGDPVQLVKDGKSGSHTPQERKDKKKKNQSGSAQDVRHTDALTPAASTPLIKVTPATASSKGKKKERKSLGKNALQSDKKRKRESGDHTNTSAVERRPSGNVGFVVGANMLQDVQSSIKAAGEAFSNSTTATKPTEEPAKKKTKKAKASRKSNDTVDFDRMAKETRSIDKKAKKEKKAKRHSTGQVQARPSVAVPLPIHPRPVLSSPPRNTPVPLPGNVSKADRIGRRDSRLLMLETPPSPLSKTPIYPSDVPIPFKLATGQKSQKTLNPTPPTFGAPSAPSSSSAPSSPSPPSSPSAPSSRPAPSSAPPALPKAHTLEVNPNGRDPLTTTNLQRYTQPLRSEPRPTSFSRAASTAASTTSCGTTPSIAALFTHVGKPYSRSGAEFDPFTTDAKKPRRARESHEEANAAEFTLRFAAVRKAVNFSDEDEYRDAAQLWRDERTSSGPLPCLGMKATGCSTKRELALLQGQSADADADADADAGSAARTALETAARNTRAAETLLHHAIRARVPVPLAPVEGIWRLFCPAYTRHHEDKYSCLRTLTISPLPVVTSDPAATHTARLQTPPRSLPFSLLPFAPPPHASFRATLLRTAVEGYGLHVVFLGNGYLLLRLDLGLLLCGKATLSTRGSRGDGVMEFLGVHESAVGFEEEEDEVEVLGRRLFARYDGV